MQGEGRLQQALELGGGRQSRQLLEQQVHVVADVRVGGDQADVGVRAGGAAVVVAGAQVHVAPQLAAFAAHDQQHLGMGLVAHHTVDHLCAGLLQAVGHAQVGVLVEARAQLHHHGDVLAVARGLHQRVDDGRVLAGAVQGLLDRQHLRIDRGLLDQFVHRRERIERVVQQYVAVGHFLEDRVAVAQRARGEGGVLQFRTLHQVVDLDDAIEVDRPVDRVHRVVGQGEVLQQRAHDGLGAVVGDLQPHGGPVAAPDQFVAQRQRQVLHFLFVHDDLGVAGHAELVGALDLHAGEQLVHEHRQHRGQQHEVVLAAGHALGQVDDARQRTRRAHDGEVAGAAECVLALQHHHDVQRLVEDLRERMRRVQAQRRQHRHDLVAEVRAQPAGLPRVPAVAAEHAHARLGQAGAQHLVPALVLRIHQLGGAVVDPVEHGRRAHAVRARRQAEIQRVAHGGGADLEELVQVGAGDAQEAQPLQQRHGRILCLGQHAEIEVQLRQFAVQVQRGVTQHVVGGGSGGWRVGGGVHAV